MSQVERLGLIAGSRALPLLVAREARKSGVRSIVAVAFKGETDPALASLVDHITWLRVGQLSKLIAVFRANSVRQCVMAGQIAPKNLFDARPDPRAMIMLLKLKEKNAHTIFGAIADELARDEIELIEATPFLKNVMPGAGFRLGRPISGRQRSDLRFGYQIAKEISRLEIGQTAVVKDGVVLAVEGFEGTDQCLLRGGELAGQKRGAIAVKVARHGHDLRFDIPCVGAQTIQTCLAAGIAALGLERDKTILLEREQVESLLEKNNLSIVTVPD